MVALGPGVTRYRIGDRIAGIAPGNINQSPDGGAFAEFVIGDAELSLRIPDAMGFEAAATLGTAITTVGQSLYQSLQLPWPTAPAAEPFPVLIYGGSSAMGTLAVQYAMLSGCKVVTTASPGNFELARAMGADEVFDYVSHHPHCIQDVSNTHQRDPGVAAKIKAATENKLTKALDTICLPGTTKIITERFLPLSSAPIFLLLTYAVSVPAAVRCTTFVPSTCRRSAPMSSRQCQEATQSSGARGH